jgi:hypothetical protein
MCPSGTLALQRKRGARCQSDSTSLYTNKPGCTRFDSSARPQPTPGPRENPLPTLEERAPLGASGSVLNPGPSYSRGASTPRCEGPNPMPQIPHPGTARMPLKANEFPPPPPPRSPNPYICGTMEGAERHLNNWDQCGAGPPVKSHDGAPFRAPFRVLDLFSPMALASGDCQQRATTPQRTHR